MNAVKSPSSNIARQLELTVNALARSMRKAIRLAEKEAPATMGGQWKVVEHRASLLQQMLKAAAEFAKSQPAPAVPESKPSAAQYTQARGEDAPTPTSATPEQTAAGTGGSSAADAQAQVPEPSSATSRPEVYLPNFRITPHYGTAQRQPGDRDVMRL